MVLGEKFEVEKRFEITDCIGCGAYGFVAAAIDTKKITLYDEQPSKLIAVKKIKRAFEHTTFAIRTLRELKMQRLLQHENVLEIDRIMLPRDKKDFQDIYVVSELMDTDLESII